jgi:hypothetical protein
MFFAVAPDENAETPANCNDVAWPKAWVVHSPLVCSLGVLLVRNLRLYRLVARVRHEFLGSATRVLHALLPLLAGKRGVGKALELLRETIR